MSELPETVRCHQIVDYFYCAERSRLSILHGLEPPLNEDIELGSKVHDWLTQRPKSQKELKMLEALKPFESFVRAFEGVKIIGHPDDLTVLSKNRVQVIEYKTVDNTSIKPWKTVLAKFQAQIYAWILEPILAQVGYQIAHTHKVIYLSRTGVFAKKLGVEHDPLCVEHKIRGILEFWKTGEPLIPPKAWKCRLCPEIFRQKCRVWNWGSGT
ncbi:MAG: hypothetical protein QXT26_08935 [Thermoproteota archaeon]